jgi:hypothetical protein
LTPPTPGGGRSSRRTPREPCNRIRPGAWARMNSLSGTTASPRQGHVTMAAEPPQSPVTEAVRSLEVLDLPGPAGGSGGRMARSVPSPARSIPVLCAVAVPVARRRQRRQRLKTVRVPNRLARRSARHPAPARRECPEATPPPIRMSLGTRSRCPGALGRRLFGDQRRAWYVRRRWPSRS